MVGSAVAALSNPAGGILGEGTQLAADLGTTASQSAALTSVPEQENRDETPQPESGIDFGAVVKFCVVVFKILFETGIYFMIFCYSFNTMCHEINNIKSDLQRYI